jgi:cysteinyl-tRNA synthetase
MRFRLEHSTEDATGEPGLPGAAERMLEQFAAALSQDLNVSEALAAVFGLVREVNTAIDRKELVAGDRQRVLEALARVDEVLGVLDPVTWRSTPSGDFLSDEAIDQLVSERDAARANKDWARADEIRDQLQALGIVIEDAREGSRWKRT